MEKGSSAPTTDLREDGNELSDISLRPFEVSDVDDFMVWASDERVTYFCTFHPYTSKEDGIDYIKNTAIPHPWLRAICLNKRPIGSISVTKNSGSDICRGELGYVLAAQYWGKGIATRAVKMAAKTIFSQRPEMERLEALVDLENVGSQRVLEKAGFMREGVLRKYFIRKGSVSLYSIVKIPNFLLMDPLTAPHGNVDKIVRVNDEFRFGTDYNFPCSVKTAYRSKQGNLYTCETLFYCIQNANLKFTDYLQNARALGVPAITFIDRKPPARLPHRQALLH
ncbi:hypothetical protein GH714_020037 [Hevea brasiliensis]|uniref:N-acetyltransferase domain-containing protein n=1 Tax=Hevea brasiliensis TaxID=3981 RepID=A0A6A6K9T8_HEVBR|nr:hypothetical protein GH714_020037 [Hevea brasiliensis]